MQFVKFSNHIRLLTFCKGFLRVNSEYVGQPWDGEIIDIRGVDVKISKELQTIFYQNKYVILNNL